MQRRGGARGSRRCRRRAVLAGGLASAATLLAGCQTTPPGEPALPSGDVAADRYASLRGLVGTKVVTVSTGDETSRVSVAVSRRPGTGASRRELDVVDTDAAEHASHDAIYVSNGTVRWRYRPASDELVRIDDGANDAADRHARFVERVVEAARADATVEVSATPNVPMLPALPDAVGEESGAREPKLPDSVDVSYEGTERVGDRQAHVIHLSPPDRDGAYERTIYFHAESFVRLRSEAELATAGGTLSVESRYEDLEIDVGVPDDRFEPPTAETADRTAMQTRQFDSRDALVAATEVAVPDPSVPDGFSVSGAQLASGDGAEAVTLVYRRGVADLYVEARTGAPISSGTDREGTEIAVGDRTGRYVRYGDQGLVTWECGDARYVIQGTLSKGTLVEVAESIDCS